MPKLVKNADTSYKREQIENILYLGIINDKAVWSGDVAAGGEVSKWSDEQVNEYYDKVITDEAVDKYEKIASNDLILKKSQQVRETNYVDSYPNAENFGLDAKKDALIKMGLSEDEVKARMNEYLEELEYLQLKHESKYGKLINNSVTGEEDYNGKNDKSKVETRDRVMRYIKLRDKFEAKEYAELMDSVKADKETLKVYRETLDRDLKNSEKPSRYIYWFNKLYKFATGKDWSSIAKYKEYKNLENQYNKLNAKIQKAQNKIDKAREFNKEVDAYAKKKAENRLNLAKIIVTKITNASVKDGMAPSEAKINEMAETVMNTAQFKEVARELKVDNHSINPDTFFNRYMMSLQTNENAAVLEKNGNNVTSRAEKKTENNEPNNSKGLLH